MEAIGKMDYSKPIEIGKGIYWIGYADDHVGLHCNPYIIIEGNEAVVIDGGSRNDFSTVMMKILQTGVNPNHIVRLIYQHYDPDLCGSLPHLEAMIHNEELAILSHRENNVFIEYYGATRPKQCIESTGMAFTFKTGRKLTFIKTPYSHSPGSFITYDSQTKTLFSSDIFGSYSRIWDLYLQLDEECYNCMELEDCRINRKTCPIFGINNFHKRIMTSKRALDYALDQIEKINDVEIIAPQHGSIIKGKALIKVIIAHLRQLEHIGIDAVVESI